MKRMVTLGCLVCSLASAHADVPADPQAREAAELRFRREAIRFGRDFNIVLSPDGAFVQRRWVAYSGELDEELEARDFYVRVGRPDLADAYAHRRRVMIGAEVVAGAGLVAWAAVLLAEPTSSSVDACSANAATFDACAAAAERKDEARGHVYGMVEGGLLGVGAIGALVALYYGTHLQPISVNDAKHLAEQHNESLRRTLGLPLADVHVTPMSTGTTNGLALSGRF